MTHVFTSNHGARSAGSRSAPASTHWVRLPVSVLLLFLAFFLAGCQPSATAETHTCGPNGQGNDAFAIYIAGLDGQDMKCILSDPERELNHVRVSPDGTKITFTRFNKKKLFAKLAEEEGGYFGTEIMVANIDGSGLRSLTRRGPFLINVNSYWTPDGRGLIYMSNDNPDKKHLRIKYLDLRTNNISNLTPKELTWVSDPHQVGTTLVFPAAKTPDKKAIRSIWRLDTATGQVSQLTHPSGLSLAKAGLPPPGDSDPKLSPDGTELAFTRHMGNGSFHLLIMELASGRVRDLSSGSAIDVMPEWSSDGRLLTFWHVDLKRLSKIGIYTVSPTGEHRRQIPLPKGYHFKMPAFVPGTGSGAGAKIVFTGKKVPQIR